MQDKEIYQKRLQDLGVQMDNERARFEEQRAALNKIIPGNYSVGFDTTNISVAPSVTKTPKTPKIQETKETKS